MREYVKPMMDSEVFAANEYFSACENGITYWFECNAESTTPFENTVYEESNNQPDLQTGWGGDTYRSGSYHACNKKHEVRPGETFLNGYVVQDMGWFQKDKVIPVLIWTEGGTNTHCTTKLKPEEFEVARS